MEFTGLPPPNVRSTATNENSSSGDTHQGEHTTHTSAPAPGGSWTETGCGLFAPSKNRGDTWWPNHGTNSVSVETGADKDAGADAAAAELAVAPGLEQRVNCRGTELQHSEVTIQSHEATIQKLREQVQFLSAQQNRSFMRSGSEPCDHDKEKLCGANCANQNDSGFVSNAFGENLDKKTEVNAMRSRRYDGRLWSSNTLTTERRGNTTGSYDIIGGSPAVSSQNLCISSNDDGYGNFPDENLLTMRDKT